MPYKPGIDGLHPKVPRAVSSGREPSMKRFVGLGDCTEDSSTIDSVSCAQDEQQPKKKSVQRRPVQSENNTSNEKESAAATRTVGGRGNSTSVAWDPRGSAASDSGVDGVEFVPRDPIEDLKNYDEFGFITDKNYKLDMKEQEREGKWKKMIFPNGLIANSDMRQRQKYWEKTVKKKWKTKLKIRVRKGIPNVFRGEAWVHLAGARRARLSQPNVYNHVLQNMGVNKDEKQIWKDIQRSLRSHSVFESDQSTMQESMYNVLCAYSSYNSSMGYNQAMSFVVSLCLLYMDEEDAFWMLHVLSTDPKYALEGVWSPKMPMVSVRFEQFEFFLKKYEPKIYAKLDKLHISPGMYQATQWFVSIFLACRPELPHSTLLRIWDVFLHDGIKAIFRIGLTLVKSRKTEILKESEQITILQLLKKSCDCENLIEKSVKIPITRKQIVQQDSAHSVE